MGAGAGWQISRLGAPSGSTLPGLTSTKRASWLHAVGCVNSATTVAPCLQLAPTLVLAHLVHKDRGNV